MTKKKKIASFPFNLWKQKALCSTVSPDCAGYLARVTEIKLWKFFAIY